MSKALIKSRVELVRLQRRANDLRKRVAKVNDPEKALELIAAADTIEDAMCNAGYRHDTETIRPANELRFQARWRLGLLLKKAERGWKNRFSRSEKSYGVYLREIGLDKSRANECERISAIPSEKLSKAFQEAEQRGVLNTIGSMFDFARPFWKIKQRIKRHRKIRDAAVEAHEPDNFGPFPLIYADPPTPFATYSESGGGKSPEQHYPTMTWKQIENFTIYDKRIEDLAHENAMLFLWCTSSNLKHALRVMEVWGFEFKASAVWDKGKQGTGQIFRNWHEVLLYGDRGKVPGPIIVPPSVFRYPRGDHSAKPPEIRKIIEQMYPDYDSETRLELFSRDSASGWTHFGLEANKLQTAAE